MKHLAAILLFSGILAWLATSEAGTSRDELSVRLRPLRENVSVSGDGLVIRGEGARIVARKDGFNRVVLKYAHERWRILDAASEKEIATSEGRKLEIRGDGLRVDLRPAPSHIQFIAVAEGAKRARANGGPLSLIGFLSIEEYLEGVVPSEVPRDWPLEALKAQAVAARSFTLATIRDRARTNPDWLLEANVTDQVFDIGRAHSRTSDAVRATAGEVLVSPASLTSSPLAVAVNYHSDCGGRTDEPTVVWGGGVKTEGVKTGTAVDAGCAVSPRNSWTYTVSRDLLGKKLAGKGLVPLNFALAEVSVTRRSEGGRAMTVGVRSLDGRRIEFSGQRLREALGYNDFKSTLFEIISKSALNGDELEFKGRGFGHGAGLCQWGARTLALSGRSYTEILKHYYPRLTLNHF